MPISVVQAAPTVRAASLTTISVTLPQPTGSGNTLIACITTSGSTANPAVSGVTLGGSADNWQAAVTDPGTIAYGGGIWYDPGAASGQSAIVVNCTGGTGTGPNISVAVYEVTGTLTFDKGTSSDRGTSGTTWTSGTTATTTVATEIFLAVAMTGQIPTQTGVGTWTTQSLNQAFNNQVSGYQIVSSTGTATFSGTVASGVYSAMVATFFAGTTFATPQAAGAGAVQAGVIIGVTAAISGAGAAGGFGGVASTRWAAPVFQQINVNSSGYAGRSVTSAIQSPSADFPGGGSPQTQQNLPASFEDITDYLQEFPWPGVIGFMSTTFVTGPGVTGLTNCLASLYLGTGVGAMTDFDSHGKPLNKLAVTSPSSLASLTVPAGSWPGAPLMPNGSAAIPAIPIIAWNLGTAALSDIAAGVYDASTVIPVAQQCKAWPADSSGNPAYAGQPGGQVLVRLMHEFNGTWTETCPGSPSQPSTTTTTDFVNAWRHIANVFAAQGATNVRWIWNPNIASSGPANGTHAGWTTTSGTTALCYPGDAYVDYIGIDGYNKFVPTWRTFNDLFAGTYNWITAGDAFTIIPGASSPGPISATKPIIITEFSSYEDDSFTGPPQTKGQFFADIATVIPASFPLVQGVMIWHSPNDALEWPATSSPAATTAWNTLTRTWAGRPAVIPGVTSQLSSALGQSIYEDPNTTPAPTTVLGSLASTAVSASFTPPANSLVVVTVSIGFHAAQPSGPVVTLADSLGNTYAAGPAVYDGASEGSYIFTHAYGASPGAITVTATRSANAQALFGIAPRVVIGAVASQAGAGVATASSGSSAISVVQAAPTVSAASATGPVTATFAAATTTGNSLVACITTNSGAVNPAVSGITLGGAAGNWQRVVAANPNVSYGGEIWYDPNCTGGQTSVAVTCSGGSGTNPEIAVTVYEVSGILAADKSTSAVATTGAAFSSGTTAVTTQPNEVFFGVTMNNSGAQVVTGVGAWVTQGPTHTGTLWQVAGYQVATANETATFSGSQTTGLWVSMVATFSAATTGAGPTTAVNGSLSAAQAGSLVYVTATVGSPESSFTPVGSTLTLATATSATDTEAAALGMLSGVTAQRGAVVTGWTVPTAADFSLAALEIFGPLVPPVTGIAAGAGSATAACTVTGGPISLTAAIAGAGVAGAVPTVAVTAPAAGAGVASAVTSFQIFAFSITPGTGDAEAVPTVGTAPGTAAGAGTALAVPAAATRLTAQGAGAATATPVLAPPGLAAATGTAVAGPVAAAAANGTGAAVAVPTVSAAGTAAGAGTVSQRPVFPVLAPAAAAGKAGALPALRLTASLKGAGTLATTGTGLPVAPAAAIAGTGRAGAAVKIIVSAGLAGAGRAVSAPLGGVNTDDTIEPGPCTLAMSVGPTTSRAPFLAGVTGPNGSTVGGSTSVMAVGNTVSDRGS